jgi:glycosyltransferase involved in cell wall biosynthesis
LKKKDVVYLNTVLPFGGALAAKCRGSKVIYHIHETTINPPTLKSFLLKVIKSCSHHNIYVSEYVRSSHDLASIEGSLIYNALDVKFLNKAIANRKPKNEANKILMVCSLKAYKGVFEFIELAKIFPKQAFNLILNASKNEVDLFFDGTSMPSNLTIFDAQKDLHPFYESADIILNLSKPDGWIETFGLTIIEGLAYGLPAIVPTVGGITEVIVEDVTGFSADSRKMSEVAQKLALLIENPEMYQKMSNASIARLIAFDPTTFKTKITNLFFRISNS